jgi:hypothetical protein
VSMEERIAMNRRVAEGYRDAYMKKSVEGGERYQSWSFAPDAQYSSPYWTGDKVIILSEQPIEAGKTAIMEAKAISLVYPDWTIIDSQIWAAEEGFTIKNKWVGTKHDGSQRSYYSYTFARTNEVGQLAHWETHVDEGFGPFIEEVIGARGPWAEGSVYMQLIAKALEKAGVTI